MVYFSSECVFAHSLFVLSKYGVSAARCGSVQWCGKSTDGTDVEKRLHVNYDAKSCCNMCGAGNDGFALKAQNGIAKRCPIVPKGSRHLLPSSDTANKAFQSTERFCRVCSRIHIALQRLLLLQFPFAICPLFAVFR